MVSIQHNNFWRHLIRCTALDTIYEMLFKKREHSPSHLTSKPRYALQLLQRILEHFKSPSANNTAQDCAPIYQMKARTNYAQQGARLLTTLKPQEHYVLS